MDYVVQIANECYKNKLTVLRQMGRILGQEEAHMRHSKPGVRASFLASGLVYFLLEEANQLHNKEGNQRLKGMNRL